jgi:hypothetical protein
VANAASSAALAFAFWLLAFDLEFFALPFIIHHSFFFGAVVAPDKAAPQAGESKPQLSP